MSGGQRPAEYSSSSVGRIRGRPVAARAPPPSADSLTSSPILDDPDDPDAPPGPSVKRPASAPGLARLTSCQCCSAAVRTATCAAGPRMSGARRLLASPLRPVLIDVDDAPARPPPHSRPVLPASPGPGWARPVGLRGQRPAGGRPGTSSPGTSCRRRAPPRLTVLPPPLASPARPSLLVHASAAAAAPGWIAGRGRRRKRAGGRTSSRRDRPGRWLGLARGGGSKARPTRRIARTPPSHLPSPCSRTSQELTPACSSLATGQSSRMNRGPAQRRVAPGRTRRLARARARSLPRARAPLVSTRTP